MKEIKNKREQMARQARTRQRNQKFSHKRTNLLESYDEQSLVALIFLMIDKDKQQLQPQQLTGDEDFQEFLEIIASEVEQESNQEKKINGQMVAAILQRYQSGLQTFGNLIRESQKSKRIAIMSENMKYFDLIRFLLRLRIIKKQKLQILDLLMDSIEFVLSETIQKISIQGVQINKNKSSQISSQLSFVYAVRFKLLRQIAFLHRIFIGPQTHQKTLKVNRDDKNSKQDDKTKCTDGNQLQILQLIEKHLIKKLIFPGLLDVSIVDFVLYTKQNIPKFKLWAKRMTNLYIELILAEGSQILTKIVEEVQRHNNNDKLAEILCFLVSLNSIEDETTEDVQIEELKTQNFSFFLQIQQNFIKIVQKKIAQEKDNTNFYAQLLNILIDLFIKNPTEKMIQFIKQGKFYTQQNFENLKIMSNMLFSSKIPDQQPILLRILHGIQDLQYPDLLVFVQIASIIVSYNDKSIELLFQAPEFSGYYTSSLNFQIILSKKLLKHFSLEIRRRAYWLLTNIAGSQLCYRYALSFIQKFYAQNILEQDYAEKNLSKEELLMKESILQIIMNFLSNLRSFNEIQELLQYQRQPQQSQNCTSSLSQNMLSWTIRMLSSVVKNISQNTQTLMQSEVFIQILIYSLYNILCIQNQNGQKHDSENILFQLVQINEIPKHLQNIYHGIQIEEHKKTTVFSMLEKLLDQIEKIKNQIR